MRLASDSPRLRLALLMAGTLAISCAAFLVGRADLSDASLRGTVVALRGTRFVAAFGAGAGLAVAGVLVQGLFRNPLASPSVLGTMAGAGLGGKLSMLAFAAWSPHAFVGLMTPDMVLPIGCLLGAVVALVVLLAFVRDGSDLLTLLLTGFILSSLFLSLGSFITSLAQERWELGRAVVSFTLGGVSGTGVRQLLFALPLIGAGLVAAWGWGPALDMLLSGEEEAGSLGLDVLAVRRWVVCWVAVLTGAAVSIGGGVTFVGLVVPHALRPLVGVEHRRLIPAAALGGGMFLVGCDVLGRLVPAQGEVPLGVVTGLIGAPVFLWLLRRVRREGGFA